MLIFKSELFFQQTFWSPAQNYYFDSFSTKKYKLFYRKIEKTAYFKYTREITG